MTRLASIAAPAQTDGTWCPATETATTHRERAGTGVRWYDLAGGRVDLATTTASADDARAEGRTAATLAADGSWATALSSQVCSPGEINWP